MANVGTVLHRISRACSAHLRQTVLEAAIADLQQECADSTGGRERVRALVSGYVAFWRSFGWCLWRDAVASESRGFLSVAGAAFAMTLAALAAAELLLLHTDPRLRIAAMRVLYSGRYGVYVGWSALINVATLMFGVPVAMFPALLFAARRRGAVMPAAPLLTIAAGVVITIIASGWVAPAIVRFDQIQSYGRAPRVLPEVESLESQIDAYPDGKAWPALIRGANAPLKHRYPGYPNYVAPEDAGLPEWHRAVIRERLALIALGLVAGCLGYLAGTLWSRRHPRPLRGLTGA
jgi:hypothetical protein